MDYQSYMLAVYGPQNNEIYHIGKPRRSGRYPWGSGGRPHQSLEKGKKLWLKKSRSISTEKKELSEEDKQKEKQRVIREGSATEVMKYKGQLTNNELQSAVMRLNLEAQLSSLSKREIESAMDKMNKVTKNVRTITDFGKAGTDLYNTIAKMYNATDEGRKNPWRIIGDMGGGKK